MPSIYKIKATSNDIYDIAGIPIIPHGVVDSTSTATAFTVTVGEGM